MLFGGKRGAQAEERWREAEVRIARLAEEVQSQFRELVAVQARLSKIEATDIARLASLAEASQKLERLVERARKYESDQRRRGGSDDARDGDESDLPSFDAVWARHQGNLGDPGR